MSHRRYMASTRGRENLIRGNFVKNMTSKLHIEASLIAAGCEFLLFIVHLCRVAMKCGIPYSVWSKLLKPVCPEWRHSEDFIKASYIAILITGITIRPSFTNTIIIIKFEYLNRIDQYQHTFFNTTRSFLISTLHGLFRTTLTGIVWPGTKPLTGRVTNMLRGSFCPTIAFELSSLIGSWSKN